MNPDLEDVREFCKDNKTESFLLRSFNEIMTQFYESDIKDAAAGQTAAIADDEAATKTSKKVIEKGTKEELISYLVAEVGAEVEFAWRSEYFFVKGQVKSEDLGSVLALFAKAGAI